MFAEKILNACCGDKADAVTSKLPLGKKPMNGEDEEIADEKTGKIDPHFKKKFTNQDMKYELTVWKKLPPKARKACEELGYDESKWDNSEDVDVSWKHWKDLTETELKAIETLGWEEAAWESKYESFGWDDLPKLQKEAAKSAGYTEAGWEDHLDGLDKYWDDLEEKDKQAMCVLGWTKGSWDE